MCVSFHHVSSSSSHLLSGTHAYHHYNYCASTLENYYLQDQITRCVAPCALNTDKLQGIGNDIFWPPSAPRNWSYADQVRLYHAC
jgi:hypothetical protein